MLVNERLDKWMVEHHFALTRTAAQRYIHSGQVLVDGQVITKPGFSITPEQSITLQASPHAFVGRGGLKLAAALDKWSIPITGRICLDIGISTGGFTDCMLQRGAALVIGVDSGHGQLAPGLRKNPRLRLLERTNARYLTALHVPEQISFFTMDVSFIAASLVVPAVISAAFCRQDAPAEGHAREAVILVKPQFEAGREFVGKHGIVRSPAARQKAIERVRQTVCAYGALVTDVMDSPIEGGDGNREYLLYARF